MAKSLTLNQKKKVYKGKGIQHAKEPGPYKVFRDTGYDPRSLPGSVMPFWELNDYDSDGAIRTSGSSFFQSTSSKFRPGTTHFKWEVFVKFNGFNGQNPVLNIWNNQTDNYEYLLDYLDTQNNWRFKIKGLGGTVYTVTFSHTASTGTWYFVRAGWRNGEIFISINNGSEQTAAVATTELKTTSEPLKFGDITFSDGSKRKGDITYDTLLYDLGNNLTATETTYIYNSGAGRVCDQLLNHSTIGSKLDGVNLLGYDLDENPSKTSGTLYESVAGTYNLSEASAGNMAPDNGLPAGKPINDGDTVKYSRNVSNGTLPDLVQPTPSKKPVTFSNLKGLDNDGTDDFMNFQYTYIPQLQNNMGLIMKVGLDDPTAAGDQDFFGWEDTSQANSTLFAFGKTAGKLYLKLQDDIGNVFKVNDPQETFSPGDPDKIVIGFLVNWQDGKGYIYKEGNLIASANLGTLSKNDIVSIQNAYAFARNTDGSPGNYVDGKRYETRVITGPQATTYGIAQAMNDMAA